MNDFRIGQHEEAIRRLQRDVSSLAGTVEDVRSDTRKILMTLAEQKVERRASNKATAKVAAIVGAVGGSATTVVMKILATRMGLLG